MRVLVEPKSVLFVTNSRSKITLACGHTIDWDFGDDPEDYSVRREYACGRCEAEIKNRPLPMVQK